MFSEQTELCATCGNHANHRLRSVQPSVRQSSNLVETASLQRRGVGQRPTMRQKSNNVRRKAMEETWKLCKKAASRTSARRLLAVALMDRSLASEGESRIRSRILSSKPYSLGRIRSPFRAQEKICFWLTSVSCGAVTNRYQKSGTPCASGMEKCVRFMIPA